MAVLWAFLCYWLFLHKDRSLSTLCPALMGREREEVTGTMFMGMCRSRLGCGAGEETSGWG